jgi:hypothetical protein
VLGGCSFKHALDSYVRVQYKVTKVDEEAVVTKKDEFKDMRSVSNGELEREGRCVGLDWSDRLIEQINSTVGMQSSLEQQRRFTQHPG